MNTRPISLTIIAWFYIVSSIFSLLTIPFQQNNPIVAQIQSASPLGEGAQQIVAVVGALLSSVWGYGFLKGKDWARVGFVAHAIIGCIFVFFTTSIKSVVILNIAAFIVVGFFLFRPAANRFFGKRWFRPANASLL